MRCTDKTQHRYMIYVPHCTRDMTYWDATLDRVETRETRGQDGAQRLFMMMKWVLLDVRLPTWLVLSEQIFALDKCFQPAGDISTLFIVFFLFLSTRNIISSKTILFQSKCVRQTRTRMVMHSILKVSNSTNHHLTSLLSLCSTHSHYNHKQRLISALYTIFVFIEVF